MSRINSFRTRRFTASRLADWRWKRVADVYGKNLPETAENFDDSGWEKADVNSDSGPLQGEAKAVFRAQIYLTEEDLKAPSIAVEFWDD